jgi:hypothetical protein
MDSNWTRAVAPEDDSDVPPLPTRAEELAYLDRLEKEFREQSYEDSAFPPDPNRRLAVSQYHSGNRLVADKQRKMLAIAAFMSPFSFWLCDKTYVKYCPLGIPFRAYPMQPKVRLWSFFLAYEFIFSWTIYYATLDQNTLEKGLWPANKCSKRVL